MIIGHQQLLPPQYPYPTVPLLPVFVQPQPVVQVLAPPQPGFATLPVVANTGEYIQESSWCEICEYDYSPMTKEVHVQTRRHLKDLRNYVRQQRLKNLGPTKPKVMDPDSCYCPICDLLIEKKHNVGGHIKGRLHIKNAKNQGVPPAPFEGLKGYCHICDLSLPACPGDPMLTHIKGQRHVANVKLIKEGKPILTEAPQVLRRKEKERRLREQRQRLRKGASTRGRGDFESTSRRGNSWSRGGGQRAYGPSRRHRGRFRTESNSFFYNNGYSARPSGWVSTSVNRSEFERNNPRNLKHERTVWASKCGSSPGCSPRVIKKEDEQQEINIKVEDGQNEDLEKDDKPAEKTIHLKLPNAGFSMFSVEQIREGIEQPLLDDGLELKYFDPIFVNKSNDVPQVRSCFLEFENRQCAERAIKVFKKSGLLGRSLSPVMALRREELSRLEVRSQEGIEWQKLSRPSADHCSDPNGPGLYRRYDGDGGYDKGYRGEFKRGRGGRRGIRSSRGRGDWVWDFPADRAPGYGGGYRGNFRRW